MFDSEFIVFSDMHYYKNISRSIPDVQDITSWFKTQKRITNEIFQYAKDNNIKTVFHNGDLFEEKTMIPQDLYNAVWDMYKYYSDEGFNIIFNSGNHDILTLSRKSSLKPFTDIVNIITIPTTFESNYNSFTEYKVIPYGMVEGNLSISEDYDYHILFIHEDIYNLEYGSINVKSEAELNIEDLEKWNVVFNGHIHKPQKLNNIYTIGSPMIQDWGEANEIKRFIHVKDHRFKSIKINCPKFIQLSGISNKIIKLLENDDYNYYRIDISTEQISHDIFKKHNVFPHITKIKERELRMLDNVSEEEDIKKFLSIIDTKLNKDKLEEIGLELIK